VCDNVVNFEIVLANGSIVNANEHEHCNLWRALRGGSNNFGIVTRFDIRTFPQGDFYGGVIASPISTIGGQLQGYADLIDNFDPYAAIILSINWALSSGGYAVFTNLEYTADVVNPPILQPFTSVQPQYLNTMRISNLTDFTNEASEFAAPGLR
jgi:hypothetical protein